MARLKPTLTQAEKKAIAALQQLADEWPKSLMLFSQAGSLEVLKVPTGEPPLMRHSVATITGIRNDGGDQDE